MSETPTAAPVLRPMSVADLVDEVFRLYRRNFATFFAISALLWLPGSVLSVLGLGAMGFFNLTSLTPTLDPAGANLAGLGFLSYIVLLPLMLGSLTTAVSDAWLSRTASVGASLTRGARTFLRILGGYALVFLAIMVAVVASTALFTVVFGRMLVGQNALATFLLFLVLFVLLMIPAVWIAVTFSFVAQTIVLERVGVFRGLARSAHLAKGARWRIVGIYLLLLVIEIVLLSIPTSLVAALLIPMLGTTGFVLGQLVGVLAQVVFNPIQFGTTTLLYYDLRIRKEAFDLALAAHRLATP